MSNLFDEAATAEFLILSRIRNVVREALQPFVDNGNLTQYDSDAYGHMCSLEAELRFDFIITRLKAPKDG